MEYVQLYDNKSKALPTPAYSWSTGTPHPIQPAETTTFFSGTSANDVFMIQQTDREMEDDVPPLNNATQNNTEEAYQFFILNNEKKDFRFTATEQDRGGFGILQFFVKNNRFYTNSHVITVPWTNKQLDISFITFRDKMEPGSQEKWQVRLAVQRMKKWPLKCWLPCMMHRWTSLNHTTGPFPLYGRSIFSSSYWNGRQNFIAVQSQLRNELERESEILFKIYDRLIDVRLSSHFEMVKFSLPGVVPNAEVSGKPQGRTAGIAAAGAKEKSEDSGSNVILEEITSPKESSNYTTTRKNFNETAFFFPDLKTDSAGNVSFSFTMPEALTQWKLMTFAHTPALALGYAQQLAVTQKELMVQPNAPRFVEKMTGSLSAPKL